MNKDPEVSLASFLTLTNLENKIKRILIQNKEIELSDNTYIKELEEMEREKQTKLIHRGDVKVKNISAKCHLYQVLSEEYLPKAKGILIYHKGRLINRLDINFGDLFWQKFFRIKYKKSFSLWSHVGIIDII